eukprot:TRINITY_DN29154_c0_g1_i1.p1 TRINITY_DN29154_c0_g1~~TRINITY_DN29154_c0_g1_i1.p1  ORF type:complete len:381 (+),score=53.34 TRINITY_DN29154_c0_g1_i1:48-1190(+)
MLGGQLCSFRERHYSLALCDTETRFPACSRPEAKKRTECRHRGRKRERHSATPTCLAAMRTARRLSVPRGDVPQLALSVMRQGPGSITSQSWGNARTDFEQLSSALDFKEGGNRWQRIGDHSPSVRNGDARVEENSLSGGRLSARGTESFGAPLVAAAFVHRLARPCRPRSLRIRFRCMPRTFGGRCSAYIALAESDTCLDQRRLDFLVSGGTTSGEGESVGSLRPAVALVFYTWSLDGASRGRGRRVVGLLGDDAGQRVRPIVDDAAASDSTDLEVRFVWGREMQLTGEATSKAEDSEALEDHDGPRLSTYDGGRIGQFAHVSRRRWKGREGLAAATAELRVGAFGRVVATSAPTAMVRCIILGVGPGSAAEIEEILLM